MKTSQTSLLPCLAATVLLMATPAAVAAIVDIDKSQITATFRQMNVPVEGRFKLLRGTIDFDPKTAATARARIEIDVASFDVGAPEYNDELRSKEWLYTSTYPKASFVSNMVARQGQNRFETSGTFTLKGKAMEIKVPFVHRKDGGLHIYEGEVPIFRKSFSIGSADWDDTLEDKVIVKFRIITSTR